MYCYACQLVTRIVTALITTLYSKSTAIHSNHKNQTCNNTVVFTKRIETKRTSVCFSLFVVKPQYQIIAGNCVDFEYFHLYEPIIIEVYKIQDNFAVSFRMSCDEYEYIFNGEEYIIVVRTIFNLVS